MTANELNPGKEYLIRRLGGIANKPSEKELQDLPRVLESIVEKDYRTRDPEVVGKVAEALIDERVLKTLKIYKEFEGALPVILKTIVKKAYSTDEGPYYISYYIKNVLEVLNDESVLKTVRAYKGSKALPEVLNYILKEADDNHFNYKKIVKIAENWGNKKVLETLKAYENSELFLRVLSIVGTASWTTLNPEVVGKVADAIMAYKGSKALPKVLETIEDIEEKLYKIGDSVGKVADAIMAYKGSKALPKVLETLTKTVDWIDDSKVVSEVVDTLVKVANIKVYKKSKVLSKVLEAIRSRAEWVSSRNCCKEKAYHYYGDLVRLAEVLVNEKVLETLKAYEDSKSFLEVLDVIMGISAGLSVKYTAKVAETFLHVFNTLSPYKSGYKK